MVKEGTIWGTYSDEKKFRVISVTEIDNHTWVYYRLDKCNPNITECQEWSCYIESFVQRFRQLPE
jgi:hypothetical protein